MPEFILTDPRDLDYNAFATLQRSAYTIMLSSFQVSCEYMTPAFYRWKFNPPSGPAKIALVFENKRMVSTNTLIPTVFRIGQKQIVGTHY